MRLRGSDNLLPLGWQNNSGLVSGLGAETGKLQDKGLGCRCGAVRCNAVQCSKVWCSAAQGGFLFFSFRLLAFPWAFQDQAEAVRWRRTVAGRDRVASMAVVVSSRVVCRSASASSWSVCGRARFPQPVATLAGDSAQSSAAESECSEEEEVRRRTPDANRREEAHRRRRLDRAINYLGR